MFKFWKQFFIFRTFILDEDEGGGSGPEFPEGLEDEIKNDPSLKVHIKDDKIDYAGLMKSYVHAQKQMGADKAIIPGKNSTDEDWAKFYDKMGRPELEKYDIKTGDDVDKEFFNNFKAQAHNAGLLPKQAQQLFDWYNKTTVEYMEADSLAKKEAYEKELGQLKEDWGKGFEKEVALSRHALKEFASEEEIKAMKDSGLLGNIQFTRLLNKIGKGLKEDTFDFESHGDFGLTREDAERKINDMFSDPDGAYLNASHPNHKKAVQDMQKYQEVLYS